MANPNPDISNLKPFKPGQSGNPGGKSSSHRKAEIKAAEIAAKVALRMVAALDRDLTKMEEDGDDPNPNAAVSAIKADILRLLKDAQDRGFGAPMQVVDNQSSDGSMKPTVISFEAPHVAEGDDTGTT